MIRHKQPGLPARPPFDETESLQTDTMRFFAVICMCLMIIFSLVKSMPVTRSAASPQINTHEIVNEKRELQQLENRAEHLKQHMNKNVPPKPVQRKTNSAEKKSPEKKTGFSLSFSSDDALFKILRKGKQAVLYMCIQGRYWRLKTASSPWTFIPVPFSGRIYYMDRQTVPDKVIRASARAVSVPGNREILFGVSLSQQITRQIRTLMENNGRGNIIIQGNGRVDFEN